VLQYLPAHKGVLWVFTQVVEDWAFAAPVNSIPAVVTAAAEPISRNPRQESPSILLPIFSSILLSICHFALGNVFHTLRVWAEPSRPIAQLAVQEAMHRRTIMNLQQMTELTWIRHFWNRRRERTRQQPPGKSHERFSRRQIEPGSETPLCR
jgi:hypothetical protein